MTITTAYTPIAKSSKIAGNLFVDLNKFTKYAITNRLNTMKKIDMNSIL